MAVRHNVRYTLDRPTIPSDVRGGSRRIGKVPREIVARRKELPKNTKVGQMYDAMVREGMDKGKAARIAQSKTGKSLVTGRKPKTNKTK